MSLNTHAPNGVMDRKAASRMHFEPPHRRELFAGGAEFGASGTYERVEGVAAGALDPSHPANRGIALLDQAPRTADGLVQYKSAYILLRPTDPVLGNGRLLYEVNNRGRIMMLANLCAGTPGNDPQTRADLGNALETGRVTGVTVRRHQTADRIPVSFVLADSRTVKLLPEATKPAIGSIYEIRYEAINPRVQGIGFAATRDIVSHVRSQGETITGRAVTHALAFGISQAGRYLRDHIAQGFNADQDGRRVFDGVLSHVAGIGRVFLNTPFAQPFRTRTWHEDHDFPEVEFPFSSAVITDPVTGVTGALPRGDASDPKLIETNTSTEYWQKGASLLHTDPLGRRDLELPRHVRAYLIAGTQHGGKAGMPRDNGPCANPRNWHDPMAAIRALLVALDEWVVSGREPPASCVPKIADGSLVPAQEIAFPAIPGVTRPAAANDVCPLPDWTDPLQAHEAWHALVPQVDPDGNEIAGIKLPDVAVPCGTFTGWNLYREPYPAGELADRDGAFIAFADNEPVPGDPRRTIAQRYGGDTSYATQVKRVTADLLERRLLLAEDAERFLVRR